MAEKLVIGCGYLGGRVAQLWRRRGYTVSALTRSEQRAEPLRRAGLRPLVGDITRPGTLPELPPAESVLLAVGYDRRGGQPVREVFVDGLRHVLSRLHAATERLLYISSTGVYGQTDGQWVDEDSACRPVSEGGRACLEAEHLLRDSPFAARCVVLRMAGLYGPGRVPRRGDLEAGRDLALPRDGHLNLVHVEDAARVVVAADERAVPPCCLVVSDGHPVTRREYFAEMARLLNAAPPRFIAPRADLPAAARAQSDKRVRNDRMLAQLGLQLAYPTVREGLSAILAVAGPVRET